MSSSAKLHLDCKCDPVWNSDTGNGFRKHAMEAGFSLGAGPGVRVFGSKEAHDLAMGELHFGTMLTGPLATNHIWRGNFEVLGSLFGGAQFNHETAYFVGLTPLLRYNFTTGRSFVPFVGGGAGVSLTHIRAPDLSTTFEFNLQVGAGMHWFFTQNMSATLEGRWLHLSNAGIEDPNNGVNTALGLIGLNWWF